MAKADGLLNKQADKKANRGKTKEQIKEEEEGVIRKVSTSLLLYLIPRNRSKYHELYKKYYFLTKI